MLTDLHIPGDSPLHRLRPARKLVSLFAFCTIVFIFNHWAALIPALGFVLVGYQNAGIGVQQAYKALRPAWIVLLIIFVAQLWLSDLNTAAFITLRLSTLLMAASLITYTTSASAFSDGILDLLTHAPAWVPKDKIALAISLVWRFIPLIRKQFVDVKEAQAARGMDRNLIALAVPLVIRTLKSADDIAEAITARSLD